MVEVISAVIPLGLGVAVSLLPVIAIFMILSSSTVLTGTWFLLGRVLALALITGILAPFAEAIDDAAGSTVPAAIGRLAIGAGLFLWALVKLLRRRAAPRTAEAPSWLRVAEGLSPGRAFTIGVLVTVGNLKEVALAAAAGLLIGGSMLEPGVVLATGATFIVIASVSVAAPLAAMALLGNRVRPALSRGRNWLVANNTLVAASVLLVIGIVLILSSVPDLR